MTAAEQTSSGGLGAADSSADLDRLTVERRCSQPHPLGTEPAPLGTANWLVKAPDWLPMDLMEHGECAWCLLPIRAGRRETRLVGKVPEGVVSAMRSATFAVIDYWNSFLAI